MNNSVDYMKEIIETIKTNFCLIMGCKKSMPKAKCGGKTKKKCK